MSEGSRGARPTGARALLLAGLGVASAAGLWLAALLWLLPGTVPPGVRLPHVAASRVFGAAWLARSSSYSRFLAVAALLGELAVLGVLALYARRGERLQRESAAGPIGTGILLGMLGFAFVWIAELPFGLAGVWWERGHGVSHQGYGSWAVASFFALGGQFLFVALAIAIAMTLARALRRLWWVAAAPAFGALALLAAFVAIYLIPSVHPLQDGMLLAEARSLERVEAVPGTKLEVQDVSRRTSAPDAETVGFGPTRRVVLWSTLLDGSYDRAELRAVIAHELGHVAHDDTPRSVGLLTLFLIPTTALIALATRRRGGMAQPQAVPAALFVAVAVSFALSPVRNAISRRVEAAADWSALQATRDPAAMRSLMRNLAFGSLEDPDPPAWAFGLGATHPTIVQRIAMTYAWEAWAQSRRRYLPSRLGGTAGSTIGSTRARSSVVNGSLRGAKEQRSFKPQAAGSIPAGRTRVPAVLTIK